MMSDTTNRQRIHFLFVILIISIGFFLRLSIYQADHVLWLDEANTASKVCWKSLSEISQLKGSSYATMHAYPIGFMACLKIFVMRFGPFDIVLRLFPFLCSLAAILLFWKLSEQLFSKSLLLVPLLLFCVNYSILEHSSELKPYASDLLMSVILIILFVKYSAETYTLKDATLFLLCGLIITFFSFPAVVILFSTAGLLLMNTIIEKKWHSARMWSGLLFIWMIGFGIYYICSLRFFMGDSRLFQSWSAGFFPWSSDFSTNLIWTLNAFKIIMNYVKSYLWVLIVLFASGIFCVLKKGRRQALIFFAPFLSILALAFLKLYPLDDRTASFLSPYCIILITYGLEFLIFQGASRIKKACGLCLLAILLMTATLPLKNLNLIGSSSEDIRNLLKHFNENFIEPSDTLLMNDSAKYAFNYYFPFIRTETLPQSRIYFTNELTEKTDERHCLDIMRTSDLFFSALCLPAPQDAESLFGSDNGQRSERVWVLLSHFQDELKPFLIEFFENDGYALQETSQQEANFLLLFVKKDSL